MGHPGDQLEPPFSQSDCQEVIETMKPTGFSTTAASTIYHDTGAQTVRRQMVLTELENREYKHKKVVAVTMVGPGVQGRLSTVTMLERYDIQFASSAPITTVPFSARRLT
jgi:hypothetical protein